MAKTIATDAEIEARRAKVLRLRLRKQSQTEIAKVLDVDQATVSRDLAWIRANWQEKYGGTGNIDVSELMGQAIASHEEGEAIAWLELSRLQSAQGPAAQIANARMNAVTTALNACAARLDLLGEYGYLKRTPVQHEVRFSADEIRAALQEAGTGPMLALPPAVDAEVTEVDNPVGSWLAQHDEE